MEISSQCDFIVMFLNSSDISVSVVLKDLYFSPLGIHKRSTSSYLHILGCLIWDVYFERTDNVLVLNDTFIIDADLIQRHLLLVC